MFFRSLLFLWFLHIGLYLCAQGEEGLSSNELSNYSIEVSLDTTKKVLIGHEIFKYVNNTGSDLNQIYFHLWANAYRSNNTDLITQQLVIGKSDMYFFDSTERGGYHSLSVKTKEGLPYSTRYQDESEEILIVELSKNLKPNETIDFIFDFEIKIPKLSSRFGHIGEYYQLTHWYPKVVKCESGLWHAMPYLEIGEYYHDFANYEVTIHLPKGFKEAATGELVSSNNQSKKYSASNVTDFAWFSSNEFSIEKNELSINDQVINLEVVKYKNSSTWDKSMELLERSLKFLVQEIGEYPFPSAKVVLSEYGGNSGMEYPMITIIGEHASQEILDHLIVHEIAHNWFYGALSSNERRYPWLDEGVTTFYDHKYHQKYYQVDPYENELSDMFRKDSPLTVLQASVQAQSNLAKLQASDLHSEEFTALNYGVSIYERPAMGFRFLEAYLGEEVFKKCIQSYYDQYKFKNPTPANLKLVFEDVSRRDLSWFFSSYISENKGPDYHIISSENNQITIGNKTNCAAPFALVFNHENTKPIWYDGFLGERTFESPKDETTTVQLPVKENLLDSNPWNNNQKRPLKLKFLSGLDNPEKRQINYFPFIGYNAHNNLYTCLVLSNSSFPIKAF